MDILVEFIITKNENENRKNKSSKTTQCPASLSGLLEMKNSKLLHDVN